MSIDKEREEFSRWAADYGLYDEPNWSKDTETDCWFAWQAGRAELRVQDSGGYSCRIIEADFETNLVTIKMDGKYSVSAGNKILCDAVVDGGNSNEP